LALPSGAGYALGMASTKNLLDTALELPPKERAHLAHELIASLEEADGPETEAEWLNEIERRLREADAGTAKLEDWDVVRTRIAARLRSR
jgi:putative addiction module component (TIGR02574 family)